VPVVDRRQLLSYVLCHIALVDYLHKMKEEKIILCIGGNKRKKGDNLGGNIIIQA